MLKIEIPQNSQVQSRSGQRNDGSQYNMYWQDGYLHQPNEAYPTKMRINVKQGQIISAGFYSLDEQSFYVDRYGALSVSRELKLKPLAQDIKKAS